MFTAYQHLLQQRSFRWFWLGFTFSIIGDAMTRVALTWFVYERTQSAEALGWLAVCYTGPVVLGGLAAGSLLDRFDRRAVMVADNVLRGVAVAGVPLLHALGQLEVWHVYVVAAVYGLLMMVSLAGSPALIPAIVAEDQLATANALETLSWTLGGVVGPMLAGTLIAIVGAPNVVILDALSYFAFALALTQLPAMRPAPTHTHTRYSLSDAVRLLLQNRVLFSTTFMFMAFNIGGGFLSVWLPILADTVLRGGPELYGFLLGAIAVGEVVSAVWVGGRTLSLPLGVLICGAQLLSGLALGLMLASKSLVVVVAALALYGAFSAPLTIWAQTLRMHIIPEQLRGRTFALLRTLMQSGGPIGGAVAGWLLSVAGLPVMILLTALITGGPGMLGYLMEEMRTGQSQVEPSH